MKNTLYELARKLGNPVIEENQVTFVWKGKSEPYKVRRTLLDKANPPV